MFVAVLDQKLASSLERIDELGEVVRRRPSTRCRDRFTLLSHPRQHIDVHIDDSGVVVADQHFNQNDHSEQRENSVSARHAATIPVPPAPSTALPAGCPSESDAKLDRSRVAASIHLMNGLILRWLSSAAAIWVTSLLFSGIQVSGVASILLASLALAVLNTVLRPLLLLVTLPLTVVTLGFFVFIVNAVVLKAAAFVVPGFDVVGFWTALFGAVVLSCLNMVLNSVLGDRSRSEFIYVEHRQG